MAVELKLDYSIDPEIKIITVKEITGAYTINNTTGWGSPNINKNSVALVLYATYQPYDKNVVNVSYISPENVYKYNAGISNNTDVYFTIPYDKDGWYKFNVVLVNVDTTTPTENLIYYNTALQKIQIFKSGVSGNLLESDWELLLNKDVYNSSTLSEILLLKLIKQRNCQLENYIDCTTCSSCKCQDTKEEYSKIDALIQATDYRFHTGKFYEAQRMTEILTKQFKCCK
jgi:hypothetical protein